MTDSPKAEPMFDSRYKVLPIALAATMLGACGGATPATSPTDSPADAGLESSVVQDAWGEETEAGGPITPHRITFAVGPNARAMTVYTINVDGTALQPAPGFGVLGLDTLVTLAGAGRDVFPVARDIPYAFGAEGASFWPGVMLPGALGTLRFFSDAQSGQVGLLAIRPGGRLDRLYNIAGASTAALANQVAVTRDGSMVAAWRLPDTLALFRSDGGTLSTGDRFVEFNLPAHVTIGGYSFVGNTLLVVTSDPTSQVHRLWRLPSSGATGPTEIALPVVDGVQATWMSTEFTVSDNGGVAITTAGKYGRSDVISIDAAQGTAINLTRNPRAPNMLIQPQSQHVRPPPSIRVGRPRDSG